MMTADERSAVRNMIIVVLIFLGAVVLPMMTMPHYIVWQRGLRGMAHLREAEQSRQIKIVEATALQEASKHLAQAEVERAKGVAQANEIIGKSLAGNESYLRYLWIQNLGGQHEVIYVPTEANLPILEAGRLKQRKEKE